MATPQVKRTIVGIRIAISNLLNVLVRLGYLSPEARISMINILNSDLDKFNGGSR